MPASIATLLMICAAALGATAAATWLMCRWRYGRRVDDLRTRTRQQDVGTREKQAALVAQIDTLRKELRDQKALVLSLSAKPGIAKAAAPQLVESLLNEPFITSRSLRKPLDFEDTQIL